MPQPDQRLDLSLIPNAESPIYRSIWHQGNKVSGTTLASASFSDGNVIPPIMVSGTSWAVNQPVSAEDGYLHMTYDDPPQFGYTGPTLYFSLDANASPITDLCFEFLARMPGNKNGLKFVKVFCRRDGNSYANTTFGMDYTGAHPNRGTMSAVSFGDGAETTNDTQNIVWLSGGNPSAVGRSYPTTAVVKTPQNKRFTVDDWGDKWHRFLLRVKFNDGTSAANEIPNGIIYVEIDGHVYADATGLFNRHPSNPVGIDTIRFGEWSQGGGGAFDIDFDSIKISTGGFV